MNDYQLKIKGIFILMTLLLLICSCHRERYRTDRNNRLSKHAEKASDYLAKQSIELTQENIENKEKNRRKARRRLERLQQALNDLNSQSKKEKPESRHKGNFKFY
jgi:hypothetical protein